MLTQIRSIDRNTSVLNISQWYIELWLSWIDNKRLHMQIALRLCDSLRRILEEGKRLSTVLLDATQLLCEKTYTYLVPLFRYGLPITFTSYSEFSATEGNTFVEYYGETFHLPTALMNINNLVYSYNVSFFEIKFKTNYSDHGISRIRVAPNYCPFLVY